MFAVSVIMITMTTVTAAAAAAYRPLYRPHVSDNICVYRFRSKHSNRCKDREKGYNFTEEFNMCSGVLWKIEQYAEENWPTSLA